MGPVGLKVEPHCRESAMFRNGSDAFFPRCFLRKISWFHDQPVLYLLTSSSRLTTQEVKALVPFLNSGLRGMFTHSPWREFARGSKSPAVCQNISSLMLRASTIYLFYTSSTAQGGGGSFKNRNWNREERLVVVNHGWQSESTDGPKGGWSCVFRSGCNGCVVTWSVTSPTTAGCSVV